MNRADIIRGVVRDLVADFMYYDRKGSETLRVGEIEAAIHEGEITIDDLAREFQMAIEERVS